MTLDIVGQFLIGIFLPALVCGIIFLSRKSFGNWVSTVAITAGFLVGWSIYTLIKMEPSGGLWPELSWNSKAYNFPPSSLEDWLPHVALLALLLGFLESLWRKNLWISWGVRFTILGLLLWRIFKGFFKNNPFFPSNSFYPESRWGTDDILINFGIAMLVITMFWLLLDILAKRYTELENSRERAVLPTALVIITSGSAFSIVLGHSLVTGQINVSLTAAIGAIMVLSWLFRGWGLSPIAVPIIVLPQSILWISGYYLADLPLVNIILLAITPLALLVPLSKLEFLHRVVLQIGLVSLPVVAAVFYIS